MRRLVTFLTEAGSQYGLGHLRRCQTVARECLRRGYVVELYLEGDMAKAKLPYPWMHKLAWFSKEPPSLNDHYDDRWLLIDSYHAGYQRYEQLQKRFDKSFYWDDNHRMDYPPGMIVNPAPYALELDYPLLDRYSYCLGADYIALNECFRRQVKATLEEQVSHIMVSMGGTFSAAMLWPLLQSVQAVFPQAHLHCVVNDTPDNVPFRPGVEWYCSPDQKAFAKIMGIADLAISAAGQSLYELICVHCPTIAIGVADNQKHNLDFLDRQGVVVEAGWYNNASALERLEQRLKQMKEFSFRQKMFVSQEGYIDGLGVQRLVDRMEQVAC